MPYRYKVAQRDGELRFNYTTGALHSLHLWANVSLRDHRYYSMWKWTVQREILYHLSKKIFLESKALRRDTHSILCKHTLYKYSTLIELKLENHQLLNEPVGKKHDNLNVQCSNQITSTFCISVCGYKCDKLEQQNNFLYLS